LREILHVSQDDSRVSNDLSGFECKLDSDIERFLKTMAIPFEKAHKSRTYLVVKKASAGQKELEILAYFSVALSSMKIQKSVSKAQMRRLNGIFADDEVPCYLIGQLAKNDPYCEEINGKELIEYAMSIFKIGHDLVGGRFVRVDCRNIARLTDFYKQNGFRQLQMDGETGLLQFVRFI